MPELVVDHIECVVGVIHDAVHEEFFEIAEDGGDGMIVRCAKAVAHHAEGRRRRHVVRDGNIANVSSLMYCVIFVMIGVQILVIGGDFVEDL